MSELGQGGAAGEKALDPEVQRLRHGAHGTVQAVEKRAVAVRRDDEMPARAEAAPQPTQCAQRVLEVAKHHDPYDHVKTVLPERQRLGDGGDGAVTLVSNRAVRVHRLSSRVNCGGGPS